MPYFFILKWMKCEGRNWRVVDRVILGTRHWIQNRRKLAFCFGLMIFILQVVNFDPCVLINLRLAVKMVAQTGFHDVVSQVANIEVFDGHLSCHFFGFLGKVRFFGPWHWRLQVSITVISLWVTWHPTRKPLSTAWIFDSKMQHFAISEEMWFPFHPSTHKGGGNRSVTLTAGRWTTSSTIRCGESWTHLDGRSSIIQSEFLKKEIAGWATHWYFVSNSYSIDWTFSCHTVSFSLTSLKDFWKLGFSIFQMNWWIDFWNQIFERCSFQICQILGIIFLKPDQLFIQWCQVLKAQQKKPPTHGGAAIDRAGDGSDFQEVMSCGWMFVFLF